MTPFVVTPLAETLTKPVVCPAGTIADMEVLFHEFMVACTPPTKVTLPWVEPKFDPVNTTVDPPAAIFGLIEDKTGVGRIVKLIPLLDLPLTVTTTFPEVADDGTTMTSCDALQKETLLTGVPLNFTELDPWLLPKPLPEIVTFAPIAPDVVDRLLITGPAAMAEQVHNTTKTKNAMPRNAPVQLAPFFVLFGKVVPPRFYRSRVDSMRAASAYPHTKEESL